MKANNKSKLFESLDFLYVPAPEATLDEAEESEITFKALMAWINGEDFEESIRHIDTARNAAIDTRRELP